MSGLAQPLLGRVSDACALEYYEDYNIINLETPDKTSNGFSVFETLEYDENTLINVPPPKSFDENSEIAKWSTTVQPARSATTYPPPEETRQQRVPKECVRQSLTDHQLLLLDPATCAFALKTKTWSECIDDHIYNMLIIGSDDIDRLCDGSGAV
jgi:hypothetical protein